MRDIIVEALWQWVDFAGKDPLVEVADEMSRLHRHCISVGHPESCQPHGRLGLRPLVCAKLREWNSTRPVNRELPNDLPKDAVTRDGDESCIAQCFVPSVVLMTMTPGAEGKKLWPDCAGAEPAHIGLASYITVRLLARTAS